MSTISKMVKHVWNDVKEFFPLIRVILASLLVLFYLVFLPFIIGVYLVDIITASVFIIFIVFVEIWVIVNVGGFHFIKYVKRIYEEEKN